jgi:hypothetical protein
MTLMEGEEKGSGFRPGSHRSEPARGVENLEW